MTRHPSAPPPPNDEAHRAAIAHTVALIRLRDARRLTHTLELALASLEARQ